MLVCTHGNFLLVRTEFDNNFDLIQKFRGLDGSSVLYNNPIDFMESGLMKKSKWDYWHIDVPFSISTDEATPTSVNGGFIGANHGCHCAVEVYAPSHGESVADVGSIWRDEKDVKFTLLRVYDENYLLFVSDNIGKDKNNYSFVKEISGKLIAVDDFVAKPVVMPKEQKIVDLCRVIRFKNKKVVAFIDGKQHDFKGEIKCDFAEVHEDYDIINPATIAMGLREARPKNGFIKQPDLADYGEPMISCGLVYRIIEDGTIFTIFDYKKLTDVRFQEFKGVMHQEKLDVFSGGIWRYFPKILPFKTSEGVFDFSSPTSIGEGAFPRDIILTREYFNDNGSPCERVVDYFRDAEGHDRLAFASGFLPVYDGKPDIRRNQLSEVLRIIYTRKYYPTFASGDLKHVKGVAYKKYFVPSRDKASFYEILFNGERFIYVDIFTGNTVEFPFKDNIKLLEKSEGVAYEIQGNSVMVKGEKGFAVFVEKIK